jgi:glucokinase
VEEGAAIRAIKRVYGEASGNPAHGLEPKDICEIADGKREGNRDAALKAFAEFGEIAGDAIATGVTLVDGLIVVGGGLTAQILHALAAWRTARKTPLACR